jgi:hypothetical protein
VNYLRLAIRVLCAPIALPLMLVAWAFTDLPTEFLLQKIHEYFSE